jgi:hypothetical protein
MTVKRNELIEIFADSHIAVSAHNGNLDEAPKKNDVVGIFGKERFGVVMNVLDAGDRKVFEVATFDSATVSAMPFCNEIELVMQSRGNWADSQEAQSYCNP